MKNRIILCLGCLLAFLQLRAQVNTNQQHLCNPNSFSIVLLGDPQNYVKYDYNQPVFELMTVDRSSYRLPPCKGGALYGRLGRPE
mgnify:CR=1 FL=1